MTLRSRLLPLAIVLALPACSPDDPDSQLPPPPPECQANVGVICTWAGSIKADFNGDGVKINQSYLNGPTDVAFDADNTAYVIDSLNHRVRKVTADGTFQTVVGTGQAGNGEPNGLDERDGGAAGTQVLLREPVDMVFRGPYGYLTDFRNHKLRRFNRETGKVLLIAGSSMARGKDKIEDGPALDAKLAYPSRAVFDKNGELFFVDQKYQRIRRLFLNAQGDGEVRTVAGTGDAGYGTGGPKKAPGLATFRFDDSDGPKPSGGLAFDASGNLYVADSLNHVIRRISFDDVVLGGRQTTTPLVIEKIAGTIENDKGVPGFTEDKLNNPTDLAMGPDGMLYVADTGNHAVRKIDLATGKITTVAGTGVAGFSGDGGPAKEAQLDSPRGVAIGDQGQFLYVADTGNHRIRRIKLKN